MKHLSRADISSYIDGEGKLLYIKQHIQTCERCSALYKEMCEIKETIKSNDLSSDVTCPELNLSSFTHIKNEENRISKTVFAFSLFVFFLFSILLGTSNGKSISNIFNRKKVLSRNEFAEMQTFNEARNVQQYFLGD